jgi:uncharacterized membrane protein YphA (DoxX/SURF4 family)
VRTFGVRFKIRHKFFYAGIKLSRGTAGHEKLLAQLGIPFSHPMSLVMPFIELLGGAALLMGSAPLRQ